MNINQKTINELRIMAATAINNAGSGHTGSSVGAATMMYALFKDHYFYNVADPNFIARDRLVLSAGHIVPLCYSLMNLFNFGISDEDLKKLRKYKSNTPGHPEYGTTKGIEVSTGPLGQGIANAVGLAIGQAIIGEKFNAQKYNIVDNYTYCYAGDGCLQEGVAQEACSLAGTLKLNKLILLYDCNNVTIDGPVSISNQENVAKKFKAMKWNVIKVRNGNSFFSCTQAISKAKKANKPTIIIFNTEIGYGTSYAGTSKIHGIALNDKELIEYKKDLFIEEDYLPSKDVKDYATRTFRRNKIELEKWNRKLALYETTHPDLYKQFKAYTTDKDFDVVKLFKPEFVKATQSTREANEYILTELSSKMPRFVGGTADVSSSTRAIIENGGDFSKHNMRGKNIHFGVREHAMGAICNGLCLYLKSPVFCSAFLAFSNYMLSPIRMAAIMNLPVWYMFSHDSYKVGEDGPSHQPIEQLGQLRLMPNVNVYRPADTNELISCYKMALSSQNPSVFCLSRQELKPVSLNAKNIYRGGYALTEEKGKVTILATGSEVATALDVKQELEKEGITAQVLSFPCLEVFEKQSMQYKNSLLGGNELKVVIEASNDNIWYKYIDKNDLFIKVSDYGFSASMQELDKVLGFTPKAIVAKIKAKL